MNLKLNKSPMRVCHISFSFLIGGIENMVVDILNEQCKTIDTHLIIVNKTYNQDIIDRISAKVQVHFINRPQGNNNPLYILKLWFLLLKLRPQAIHCHSPKLIMFLLPFKRKCLYTVHNIGISLKNLNRYKQLFAISNAVKNDLYQRGSLASELVYNGIHFDKFVKKTNYEFDADQNFKIVQVSRLLHEQKGQDILIKAVHMLIQHNEHLKIELHIIGDGPSENNLKELVASLELDKIILFIGPKDRSWIYNRLNDYDVLIQPSRFEGFGLTVLEAIAAGIPVIASDIDGPAEVLKDMASAYLFENENIEELSSKITDVMADYKSHKIPQICQIDLSKAKRTFSVDTTAAEYCNHYRKLSL
jgi:glycosyltransferase involved in cell wall biosynthesis